MDEVEHGQEREQQDRERAIAAMRSKLPPVGIDTGERECTGCGAPIDARRRAAQPGTQRCIECQWRWEKYGV